jgi:hypothetical protein
MNSDDIELLLLFSGLGVVLALSLFFWFARKLRDGWLLRILYILRLFYAAFFAYGIVWLFQVLYGQAPLNQILLVAMPFGILFVLLALPWGLLANLSRHNKADEDKAALGSV